MSLPTLNQNNEEEKESKGGIPSLPSIPGEDNIISSEYLENNEDFEELEVEETYEDGDYDNQEIYASDKSEELPLMDENEDMYLDEEDDYNPDYEEDLEAEYDNKFIDKKKKRLIPFGGKKSKRKVKSSDFDGRKNIAGSARVMRTIVLLVILLTFMFGVKNTFFPSHVYSDEQIRELARQGAGKTNFPKERGEAFAESFLDMYLTVNPEDAGTLDLLNYYYGRSNSDIVNEDIKNLKMGRDVVQKTLISPKVYESNVLSDYSAQFKLSSYVSSTDGSESFDTGRWISFSINVYYNEENDSLSITKDSPSLIPQFRVMNITDTPDRLPLGNGTENDTIGPSINPTINGFIEAYANSSLYSHEPILQYIDDKQSVDLVSGFGGAVSLKGSPQDSIKRTIYNNDDGVYRAALEIEWVDNKSTGENKEITYISRYIMRIKPVEGEEGKYVVSSFVPVDFWK